MKIEGYAPLERKRAEEYVCKIIALFSDIAEVIPAGSFRRGKPVIEDLDFVIIPKDSFEKFWEVAEERLGKPVRGGTVIDNPKSKQAKIVHSQGKYRLDENVACDIFLAEKRYVGSTLLFRTGSGQFNCVMRVRALKLGMKLNRYGLMDRVTNELIGEQTEKGIFETLGMMFREPKDREVSKLSKGKVK